MDMSNNTPILNTAMLAVTDQETRKQHNKQMLRWAIRNKITLEYVGGAGVNHFEHDRHVAVIGYELCQAAWGKGYVTEALTEVIDFLFSQHSMHRVNRIEAYVMQGNFASEAILNKLGFTMEGILREHSYWKGKYHNLSLYSLLREDGFKGDR